MPYKVALATVGLPSMYERRETITAKLFSAVISNPDHKLHSLSAAGSASENKSSVFDIVEVQTSYLFETGDGSSN